MCAYDSVISHLDVSALLHKREKFVGLGFEVFGGDCLFLPPPIQHQS